MLAGTAHSNVIAGASRASRYSVPHDDFFGVLATSNIILMVSKIYDWLEVKII